MSLTVGIEGSERRLARKDDPAVRASIAAAALPLDGRADLADGVPVGLSPSHDTQMAAGPDLIHALRGRLDREHAAGTEAIARLSDNLMPGPDIGALRRLTRSHGAKGADFGLAIDIAHTTLARHRGRNAERRARHGVPDDRVVDLAGKRLDVRRAPSGNGSGSIAVQDRNRSGEPSRLPGVAPRLSQIVRD